MSTIAVILFFLSIIMLILGIINPRLAFMGGRKSVIFTYSALAVLFLIISGTTYKETPEEKEQKKIIEKAESYLEKGEYELAVTAAKKAKELLDNYKAEDIIEKSEEFLKSDQNYQLGIELFKNKKYLESIEKFDLVLKEDNKNYKKAKEYINLSTKEAVGVYKTQVISLFQKGEYDKANQLIEKGLDISSEDADLLAARGSIGVMLFKTDKKFDQWLLFFNSEIDENGETETVLKDLDEQNDNAYKIIKDLNKLMKNSHKDLSKAKDLKSTFPNVEENLNQAKLLKDFTLVAIDYHKSVDDVYEVIDDTIDLQKEIEKLEGASFDKNAFLHGLIQNYSEKASEDIAETIQEKKNESLMGRWFGYINEEDRGQITEQIEDAEAKANVMHKLADLVTDTNEENLQEAQEKYEKYTEKYYKLMSKGQEIEDEVNQSLIQVFTVLGMESPSSVAVTNAVGETVEEQDDEEIANASVKADTYYVEELINNYEYAIIEAINLGDFSVVEPLLTPGSNLYNSQKKLVNRLANEGTTEELVLFEINDMILDKKTNDYKVYVKETITIYKADGQSTTKDFKWIYTVNISENAMGISDILQWK